MDKEEVKKNKNQIKNKSVSEGLLVSYRNALMKVKEYFDSVEDIDMEDIDKAQKTMAFILKCGADLGKNIETLAILEKKVQSEESSSTKIRGGAKLSLLEEGEI